MPLEFPARFSTSHTSISMGQIFMVSLELNVPATAGGRASVSETLAIAGSSIEAPKQSYETSSQYLSFSGISMKYADGTCIKFGVRGNCWKASQAARLTGVSTRVTSTHFSRGSPLPAVILQRIAHAPAQNRTMALVQCLGHAAPGKDSKVLGTEM